MSITEKENSLFRRWRKKRPLAVSDGLVNERLYKSSSLKILFVMKETNNTPTGFDLREFLRKPIRPQTWDNVARWLTGIASLHRDIPWKQLASVSDSHRAKMLGPIAVMNLKKIPGGHTTINDNLRLHAREDAGLLAEQFRLYKPDLVICCGTVVAEILSGIISIDHPSEWPTTSRGISYWPMKERGHIVSYAHPEARVDDCLIFYGLIDAIRELRRNRRKAA
ncbi:MAG: hypothetical protein HYZ75_11895 [Elusimicrobia bacterium]|nr:hypothetical protein [Elusimicrobiota bacterium]